MQRHCPKPFFLLSTFSASFFTKLKILASFLSESSNVASKEPQITKLKFTRNSHKHDLSQCILGLHFLRRTCLVRMIFNKCCCHLSAFGGGVFMLGVQYWFLKCCLGRQHTRVWNAAHSIPPLHCTASGNVKSDRCLPARRKWFQNLHVSAKIISYCITCRKLCQMFNWNNLDTIFSY